MRQGVTRCAGAALWVATASGMCAQAAWASPGPVTPAEGHAAGDDIARRLAEAAWAEWSALSAEVRSGPEATGLGSAVWNLRRRTADRDTLMSMAVAVEQGEESCLCGKTSPTAADLERQGLLIAEAVLLWHLAENADGVRHNTQRLRNVTYKAADAPYAPLLWTALLRLTALTGGDHRADDAAEPRGYGALAVREAAVLPEPMRSAYLAAAARWPGLPEEARTALLAACEPPRPATGLTADATASPAADGAPATGGLGALADQLSEHLAAGRTQAVADALGRMERRQAVWLAMQVGRRAAVRGAAEKLETAASALPAGLTRVALRAGAGLELTRSSPRAVVESLLLDVADRAR
ncbi:MAG: hypothetical protein ACK4PI_00965 [Tepidisphaerales bacterium]